MSGADDAPRVTGVDALGSAEGLPHPVEARPASTPPTTSSAARAAPRGRLRFTKTIVRHPRDRVPDVFVLGHSHPEEARPASAPRTSLNWPALRSVRRTGPALRGRALATSRRGVGRPRLPALVGRPPRAGTRVLPTTAGSAPTRSSEALVGVEPAPASASGPRTSGHGLPAQSGGHRARRRALATSDAGFALADSPRFVGEPRSDSSARRAGLAASRPLTRAARREWRSPRCRRGAQRIFLRASVVRLGPFHGRRLESVGDRASSASASVPTPMDSPSARAAIRPPIRAVHWECDHHALLQAQLPYQAHPSTSRFKRLKAEQVGTSGFDPTSVPRRACQRRFT